jgi:2-oxoisovalerate dehydrogenase E2 component (dihydrolipoyl transacylase)
VAKVTMPQLGESVAEGTIGKWLKQVGDHVAKYEPLLEVITDKVNAEVPSPVAGVLTEILVQEGETVPNNAEIAIIDEAGEVGAKPDKAAAAATAAAAASEAPAATAPAATAVAAPPTASAPVAAPAQGPAGSDERPARSPEPKPVMAEPMAAVLTGTPAGDPDARMTPAVRRLLREHGLEAVQIVGSGGGGRLTRDDVLDFVEAVRTGQPVGAQGAPTAASTTTPAPTSAAALASAPAASRTAPTAAPSAIPFPDGADEFLVPMTKMRKGIAAQMTRALAVPHAYVHMEVDVTNLVRLRDKNKREYQAREGISLSYVPFVVKACVEALRRNPTFNAHWTDAGLLAKRRINVGVAVAVDDGLIVPVVRDVDQSSVNGINHAIADVAGRARDNRLRVDDFGGGSFTLDNTGWLGSNLTMPIINVPEVAILTMEAITKRAVVVETESGDAIAIRPVMNLVMGIDHRANDGAGAAAFLRDVKAWLESVGPNTAIF